MIDTEPLGGRGWATCFSYRYYQAMPALQRQAEQLDLFDPIDDDDSIESRLIAFVRVARREDDQHG